MSSGHAHHRHAPLPAKLEAFRTPRLREAVDKLLAKAKTVEGYDNPYLVGRSTNMRRIYPDRHFPKKVKVGSKTVDTRKTTARHEATEWLLMKEHGLPYEDAHRVANAEERDDVEAMGVDWKEYCSEMDNYIKGAEHDKIRRVPADLDLSPFEDEKDRKHLTVLRARMGKDGASAR